MKSHVVNVMILLLGLFTSAPAHALKSDREQPIKVNADSMIADEPKGISHYKGNVVITQGSLKVNADEVMIYFVDGILEKLIINGDPAHLQQMPDNGEEPIYSQANRIEYYASSDRLFLIENASVKQGPNFFSGARIEYDTRNSTVSAKSGGESDRVQTIITPQTKTEPTTEQKTGETETP